MNIQCPHCCAELTLPDEAVGRKVQCACYEEKFIAEFGVDVAKFMFVAG